MNTDLAWAAGFFDGEGCTMAKHGTRKSVQAGRFVYSTILIEVAQKERFLLDKLCSILKTGKVYGPYNNGAGHYHYKYIVSKYERVNSVIELLWPYLGPYKRTQARKALDAWKSRPRLKPGRRVHAQPRSRETGRFQLRHGVTYPS